MLRTWSEIEKVQLLKNLKKYGSGNVELITAGIPTKTLAEVERTLEGLEKDARKAVKAEGVARFRKAPIDNWIDVIKRVTPAANADLATVLKVFAHCEERVARDPDDVNLKDLYLLLADLALGKAPKRLNKKTHLFLMKTISRVARKCKRTDEELEAIKHWKPTPICEMDLKAMKNIEDCNNLDEKILAVDPVLNPLRVPEVLLKKNPKKVQNRTPTTILKVVKAMKNGKFNPKNTS